MRIEAYHQIQQVYKPKQTAKNRQADAVCHSSDQLQISSTGKDFQIAKAAVAEAPDVREDLVATIKARMDNGTYQVSASAFAGKLLAKYDEMR